MHQKFEDDPQNSKTKTWPQIPARRRPVKTMPKVGDHIYYDHGSGYFVVPDEDGISVPILSILEYETLSVLHKMAFRIFETWELVSLITHRGKTRESRGCYES